MAVEKSVSVTIRKTTKAVLDAYCKATGAIQVDIIDAAVWKWLEDNQ
jgi:hypothetical protein